jgi:hypothetical protein
MIGIFRQSEMSLNDSGLATNIFTTDVFFFNALKVLTNGIEAETGRKL